MLGLAAQPTVIELFLSTNYLILKIPSVMRGLSITVLYPGLA